MSVRTAVFSKKCFKLKDVLGNQWCDPRILAAVKELKLNLNSELVWRQGGKRPQFELFVFASDHSNFDEMSEANRRILITELVLYGQKVQSSPALA